MRIYILGAGASKPDGVPLTHEFIQKVFDKFGGKEENKPSLRRLPFDRVSVIEPVLKRLDAYHRLNLFEEWQQYLTTGDRNRYPLEVGTEQIESFFTEICSKAMLNLEDADILQKLHLLFFHTICHASIMTEGRKYRRFIDSVMRLSGKKCIVSFNYDLLLENALMEKVGDESEDHLTSWNGKWIFEGVLPWRYGVEFSCLEEAIEFKFASMDEAQIIYFKLHGSFNWTYCQRTKEIKIHGLFKDPDLYERLYHRKNVCECGNSDRIPLLVPPVKNKEILIPALKKSWKYAGQLFEEAKEIFIVGYSLPDADLEARKLLKRISLRQIEKICIVNRSAQHVQRLIRALNVDCHDPRLSIYDNFEALINET